MVKYILEASKQIMEGTLPYQTFTKDLNSSSFSTQEKHKVRTLVNALLNRYYRYLYSLTGGEETSLTVDEVLALALYSFNVEKSVIDLSYETLLATLPAQVQVKLEEAYPAESFPIRIPQSFHRENLELSYATRFSAPLFAISQLIKDIGKKNILRFLSKRPSENCGLINEKIISNKDFFAKYPNFKAGSRPDAFVYDGKDYIKKSEPYANNEIILTSQSLLDVADLINEKKPETLLFMQFEDTSLLLLIALLFPNLKINYSAVEAKSKFILHHLARKFNLDNVTYVNNITHTYDLVLTTLSSSGFNGNIRHRDFYFRLAEDLETYTAKAREELLSVKDYVNEKGTLIFLTTTALRSETHYQALSFIRDYPEFILEREKQYFHFTDFHETIYYALFTKGSHEDKA